MKNVQCASLALWLWLTPETVQGPGGKALLSSNSPADGGWLLCLLDLASASCALSSSPRNRAYILANLFCGRSGGLHPKQFANRQKTTAAHAGANISRKNCGTENLLPFDGGRGLTVIPTSVLLPMTQPLRPLLLLLLLLLRLPPLPLQLLLLLLLLLLQKLQYDDNYCDYYGE